MSCDTAGGLLIYLYIKRGITIIMVIAPILLLVLGTMDFMGAVTSGDEKGMRKSIQTFLKRMLICIVILLLPHIIGFIMSFTGIESNFMACIDKATDEAVKELEEKEKQERTTLLEKKVKQVKEENIKQEVEAYINGTYNEGTYNELLDKIKTIDNEQLKQQLLDKMNNMKKDSNSQGTSTSTESGEMRVPTAVENQRSNILGNALSGLSASNLLAEKGSSVEAFNNKIQRAVNAAGVGTRKASAAAATTLIDTLNSYGYKINYEWWGKYPKIGINPNWGNVLSTARYNRNCNNYAEIMGNDGSNCWDNMQWYGLDCSGFVEWALVQATGNTSIYTTAIANGKIYNLNSKTNYAQCDIGDTIHSPGHIALIIGKDNSTKTYKIAESSNGVTYNSAPYTGNGWLYCKHLDIYKKS